MILESNIDTNLALIPIRKNLVCREVQVYHMTQYRDGRGAFRTDWKDQPGEAGLQSSFVV